MKRFSKHMEPPENFFERTWGAFKRLSTIVKVLIVAAPFAIGLGTIIVSFIALKNYQEEQLKSEIIEFVKNSTARGMAVTNDEAARNNMESESGGIKVIGWRIWSKSSGKPLNRDIVNGHVDGLFDPSASTHLVGYAFENDKGDQIYTAMTEVIWPERILRSLHHHDELLEMYDFNRVD